MLRRRGPGGHEAAARAAQHPGGHWGHGTDHRFEELVRSLHAAGLVDGYTLLIHPILLGSGTRLFADGDRTDLELRRSVTTTTGVIIADYEVRRAS